MQALHRFTAPLSLGQGAPGRREAAGLTQQARNQALRCLWRHFGFTFWLAAVYWGPLGKKEGMARNKIRNGKAEFPGNKIFLAMEQGRGLGLWLGSGQPAPSLSLLVSCRM